MRLHALERFVRDDQPKGPSRAPVCDLCAAPIDAEHPHVVDLQQRSLQCACRACAVLFRVEKTATGPFRTVPDRILRDDGFFVPEELWDDLGIPVRLAFLFFNASRGRAFVGYPSPAGAVETEITDDAWAELRACSALARRLEPDVEALLFYGERGSRAQCMLVPIDACYRLVARLRRHWEGFDGGDPARRSLDAFLADLHRRSRPLRVEKETDR